MKTRGLRMALMALMMCCLTANAEEAEINGLWYELVSRAKEAKVIKYKNDVEYFDDVVIPETVDYEGTEYSVTSIGDGAFQYCSDLTSVTIGNSVTTIGEDAFTACYRLTSVTIPNSVTSIGEWAFDDCSSLTSVHITDLAAWCKISFSESSNPLIYAHHLYLNNQEITNLVIPDGMTSIGDWAFSGCSGLTSVTIPNSVTSIGDYAFRNCSGLTSVTIPGSVTSIGSTAFYGCSSLTSVTIGNSVTSIGESAFYNCSGLTSLTIPNSVTSIGYGAFKGCSGLTSVTIPNSVTSIGNEAFAYCSGLTSVTIPNSVTSIGSSAFQDCSSLTSVTIPNSVTSIGGGAFWNCTALTSVTIPNSVTSIGEGVFRNCSALTSVDIPNSVTSIGNYAFQFCSGLTSVTIPNSVTSIGNYAFQFCSGLTSVTIGNGVTSIGSYAFRGCSGLTSVTIPNSVTSIGGYAFEGCNLESVISLIEEPFAIAGKDDNNYRTFSLNTFNNATLYVPAGTIDKYKATAGWKDFLFIEEVGGGTPEEKVCAKPTIHYQNGQLSFQCATEGVEFISEITDSDIKKSYTAEVDLSVTYHISVYATKAGYTNSETATATLCWIDVEPQKEGITGDAVTEVKAMPVLIQSEGSGLTIEGAEAGTPISVYDLNGRLIGNTTAVEGATRVNVAAAAEKVVIVKVGERSVKVRK